MGSFFQLDILLHPASYIKRPARNHVRTLASECCLLGPARRPFSPQRQAATIARTWGCLIVLYYDHTSRKETINILPKTGLYAKLDKILEVTHSVK